MSNIQQGQAGDQPDTTLPPVVGGASADETQHPPIPPLQATPSPTADPKVQSMLVSLPTEAQDTDLIEKEWVEKAKQIVQHTTDDPFAQQAELAKMKAEYMKKRFNKDIKLSDQQG